MTQEIYDYLLIRSNFVFDKDAMIEYGKNKEDFKYLIHCVAELMQKESFFIAYPDTLDNVMALIQKYRFDYNKDKEINEDMNFIIERRNYYNSMSHNRKVYLAKEWLKKEYQDRELPTLLQTKDTVTGGCMNDVGIFLMISGYKIAEDGKHYDYVGDKQEMVVDVETSSYLGLLNLLANRFPGFYYDEYNLKNALYNVVELLKTKPNMFLVRYIKRTLRNLKGLDKEIDELNKELKLGTIED